MLLAKILRKLFKRYISLEYKLRVISFLNKNGAGFIIKMLYKDLGCNDKRLIKKYKLDLYIDVGANIGHTGLSVATIFKIDTLSYEPVSHTYEQLKNKAKLFPNWGAYQMGIGATNGKGTIHVTSGHSGTSSFLKINEHMASHAKNVATVIKQEEIEIKTLDFCIENHITGRDKESIYIKVDTQGYEMNVMKGLEKYIDKVCIIKLEMSLIPLDYQGQPNLYEIIKYMNERGFIIVEIEEGWKHPKT